MTTVVSIDIRREQLSNLIDALNELIAVLEHDADCKWTNHFKSALQRAKTLHPAFTQEDLNHFSASVMCVYGGMGSFSDYAPGRYDEKSGKIISFDGMENLEVFAAAVYERAFELRVIGRR